MGHRLSKITTRTGDNGTTGLGDGTRVGKDHPRIAAMGDIDELSSVIGLLLCESVPTDLAELLVSVQQDLFDLGAELSIPGHALLKPARVAALDQALARLNETLPPLKEFVLPGGSRAGAACHVARAVCRRAERKVYGLGRAEGISPQALPYLNRLSDLLFVLARSLNRAQGATETTWRGPPQADP